ncbi:anthocyanidin 3-O-glucosyltransferase 2-like [Malania oleifera]|uniref:anthocyanidin 3-O-glucosyltransferase 2-like n=1 Tax=Malania oleifera TaxID=397392 RepID=UPI0025AECD28|nr:anthocyanidin 3-O-glucosyltransferase 2-like [Malania oleifera]
MEKRAELVFIPSPLVGHLVSTVEIAKLLLLRHRRLSVTLLLLPLPSSDHSKAPSYAHSLASSTPSSVAARIRFLHLPPLPPPPAAAKPAPSFTPATLSTFMESYKPAVRDAVSQLGLTGSESESDPAHLAGFVVDMFCIPMIDVADEFGVPSYLFFTSGACALGLALHLQTLHDELGLDPTELKESDELSIPCFVNPVPAGVLPSTALDKENGGATAFINRARSFRRAKGIMVNTFMELESHVLQSILQDYKTKIPTVYPVGPIVNLGNESSDQAGSTEIMTWLNAQPPLSVVFLCFGSMGSFGRDQVKEIAGGVENSGYRFLWSLRKPPPKNTHPLPGEYASPPEEILPEGFIERTAEIGRIIGWAPQVAILSHPSIGGFVSHCGWNSTLESVWCGVPIATWPMYAEQQINAFQMVKELGLSVEITLDYRKDVWKESSRIVSAGDIERGIRVVMEEDCAIRGKVKEMKEKSRKTLLEGGSAYASLGRFIEDVVSNMP